MNLEQKVKKAIPKLWGQLQADVDWPIDLEGAVELCLDAGRLVSFGYMTNNDYDQAISDPDVDDWAKEALKGYF